MRFRFQFKDRTSYIKVNKWGTFYILLTISVGFAATNTMNNLLYLVLAFLLSLMTVSGIVSRRNLREIEFNITPPPEIYKNKPAYFVVKIRSRRGKKFNIFVELEGVRRGLRFVENDEQLVIPVIFRKRRTTKITNLKIFSSFPFSFFTREENFNLNLEITVFPEIYDVSSRIRFFKARFSSGEVESQKPGTGGDFLGLREYYEGDPVRLIHWKVSARNNELYTKIFSGPGWKEIILTENDLTERDYERKINEMASLAAALLADGYSVGIKMGKLTIPPDTGNLQKRKILRELALL